MAKWITISAQITAEEKELLDRLNTKFGLNPHQSMRKGIELLGRFIGLGEFYATTQDKAMKKIAKEANWCQREFERRVNELIKKYPEEFTEEKYGKVVDAMQQTLTPWDIFSQERKRGRKSEKKGRGRPRI